MIRMPCITDQLTPDDIPEHWIVVLEAGLRQISNTAEFPSDEAHQECVDIAKELLALVHDGQRTVAEWTKVSDAMPERGQRVLVWGIKPWHPKGFYSVTLIDSYGVWSGYRFPEEHYEILYWAHLPDAPDHDELRADG